jgi:hypothetical protein
MVGMSVHAPPTTWAGGVDWAGGDEGDDDPPDFEHPPETIMRF